MTNRHTQTMRPLARALVFLFVAALLALPVVGAQQQQQQQGAGRIYCPPAPGDWILVDGDDYLLEVKCDECGNRFEVWCIADTWFGVRYVPKTGNPVWIAGCFFGSGVNQQSVFGADANHNGIKDEFTGFEWINIEPYPDGTYDWHFQYHLTGVDAGKLTISETRGVWTWTGSAWTYSWITSSSKTVTPPSDFFGLFPLLDEVPGSSEPPSDGSGAVVVPDYGLSGQQAQQQQQSQQQTQQSWPFDLVIPTFAGTGTLDDPYVALPLQVAAGDTLTIAAHGVTAASVEPPASLAAFGGWRVSSWTSSYVTYVATHDAQIELGAHDPDEPDAIPGFIIESVCPGSWINYSASGAGLNHDGLVWGPGCPPDSVSSFDAQLTVDPQEANLVDAIDLLSVLTITYAIGDWSFTSITTLDDDGWQDQEFVATGVLGGFAITSRLDFDPDTPAFTSWTTDVAITVADIRFASEFTLAGRDLTLVLSASGYSGAMPIDVDVTFGGDDNDLCDLDWAEVEIEVGLPFCCVDLDAALFINCLGFDRVEFVVSGISVPALPWVSFGAQLEFTMQTKSLVLTSEFDFGAIACVDLFIDVETSGNLTVEGFQISGMSIECDIGAVTFAGITYFGDDPRPGLLEDTPYFEVYWVRTHDLCFDVFNFELAAYFLDGGIRLFDLALIDVDIWLEVSSPFTFNMGLEIDVDTGAFTEWTVGFRWEW